MSGGRRGCVVPATTPLSSGMTGKAGVDAGDEFCDGGTAEFRDVDREGGIDPHDIVFVVFDCNQQPSPSAIVAIDVADKPVVFGIGFKVPVFVLQIGGGGFEQCRHEVGSCRVAGGVV